MSFETLKETIRRLPSLQRQQLDRIAIGLNPSRYVETEELVQLQLVEKTWVSNDWSGSVGRNYKYFVATRVHMAWCEVCSEEHTEDE